MGYKLVVSALFLFFAFHLFSQPSNDDPCNAIALTVESSCYFLSYSNAAATDTGGVPNPGCAGYAGGDVWFTFIMPYTGYHTVIEMGAAGITDGGMAVYTGLDCNSLSLVSCDDNSGPGNMPMLTIEDGCGFQNAGTTFWVRVWENGNNNNGTFDICAYSTGPNTPPGTSSCNGNLIAGDACCDAILLGEDMDGYCGYTDGFSDIPDEIPDFCAYLENNSWIAFIASDTTTVIDITSSNCWMGNGIQAAIFETSDCTNFTTVSNCWNPTSEGTGTLTANDLTIGETYYILIDGWGNDLCDYVLNIGSGVQTVNVTANDYELCQGQSTQLNANVLGSGNYSYNWSPAGSLDDPNSATPVASPSVSTDYMVTITGIEDSIHTVSIIVYPAAPVQPIINGLDGVCQNAAGLIYYTNTTDAIDYFWTVSGSASIVGSSSADSVIVDFGMTKDTICVTASNDCGTSPQACFNVNVVIEPDISATDPPPACSGNSFDLTTIAITNNASGGGPITYYQNQADADVGTNPIIPPLVNISGSYIIKMETGVACYDVTSVNVTVEDPQLQVTDPAPECTPDSVDLSVVSIVEINGFPGGIYSFYTDSLDAANANSPMISPLVYASNTYWVRYETPNGCFDVAPINVTIDNTPDITVLQPAPICPGGLIDLDTITLIDANGAAFTKDFYDNQALAILGNPAFALNNTVVSNPQTYYLRAETIYGCVQIVEIIITTGFAPQGEITGGGTFCSGSNANITFNLLGSGPFDVVYTDGSNFFPLNNINNGHIESVVLSGNVTYSLFSIWDTNGCSGTINGSSVTIIGNPPVSALLSGNATICGSGIIPLSFSLNGTGPFTVEYSDGVNSTVTLNGINDGHIENVNVSANTTFFLISVTDALGCSGLTSGTAVIDVVSPLQISNVVETCDDSYTSYTVSFEINGGATPYSVSGGTGTFLDNIFKSDWIASGSNYYFEIDDINNCGPTIVTGSYICNCISQVGIMGVDDLTMCEDETASAQYDSGAMNLDGNDALGFVLHDASGSSLENVFMIGPTPDFNYDPVLNFGMTYYISAIVANDDGSGFPVLDPLLDPCISVAAGQPVVFTQTPIASISGDNMICQGDSTDIIFNIVGSGLFDVLYSEDGVNSFQLNGINDGFTLRVSPENSVDYEILSVAMSSSPNCSGIVNSTDNIVSIAVVDVPEINDFQVTCSSTSNEFIVSFEINGGNPANYSVLGNSGNLSGNVFTSDWVPGGTTYSFQVVDGLGCLSEVISAVEYCNCTPDISPSIFLVDPISCFDESDGALEVKNINGLAPFSFDWDNGVSGAFNTELSVGWYKVTMTDANNCISVDSFWMDEPAPIDADLVVENPSCYGEDDGSITFENVIGGSGNYDFSLNVISSYTSNMFYDLSGGNYEATIIDSEGCEWNAEAFLEEPQELVLDLGADLLINFGDSIQLIPQTDASVVEILWTSSTAISCDTCLNQVIAPLKTSTYFLSLIDENGCAISDEITVQVSSKKPIYVPSAFTPNGDGFNDCFKVYCGDAVEQIRMFRIFNRWGALVYEANDIDPNNDEFGWDGTLKGEFVENGVYIYYVETQFKNGESGILKGDVTLLR